MRYHELLLRGLPEPIIGHQAREFFALYGHTVLPAGLFHYGSDGKVIPDAEAPIRFHGRPAKEASNGHAMVVLGVGDRGAELLYPNARKLAEVVLTRFPGWLPRCELKEGVWAAAWTGYAVPQVVNSMVIEAKAKGDTDDLEFVKRRLVAALNREFAEVECDITVKEEHITNLRLRRSVPVNIKSTQYLPALTLDFEMPIRLTGPWQIGKLKARGYGRLTSLSTRARGER